MDEKSIESLFENFEKLTVLVIGDVMIDAYLWGRVDRISPEAPVPVVQVTDKENRLGGAANVALNLVSLGAKPIICAVAGADQKGEELVALLENSGISAAGIVHSESRPTTVKTRVISNHQHVVRVDEESTKSLNPSEEQAFIARIEELIAKEKPDVIIFEDYNKGLLTPTVIDITIAMAKREGIPTTVDPKKLNFFAYKGVSLFKPNLKELSEGLKIDIDKKENGSLERAVAELEAQIENEISLITLSELGVFVKDQSGSVQIPAHIRKISDVSGAGDTVIAVASLCIALKTDVRFMAGLSNLAGGLVCEKVGVVPIEKSQLLAEAKKQLQQ